MDFYIQLCHFEKLRKHSLEFSKMDFHIQLRHFEKLQKHLFNGILMNLITIVILEAIFT